MLEQNDSTRCNTFNWKCYLEQNGIDDSAFIPRAILFYVGAKIEEKMSA